MSQESFAGAFLEVPHVDTPPTFDVRQAALSK